MVPSHDANPNSSTVQPSTPSRFVLTFVGSGLKAPTNRLIGPPHDKTACEVMMSVAGFGDKKMRSSLPDFGHLTTNETARSKTRTVFSFRFKNPLQALLRYAVQQCKHKPYDGPTPLHPHQSPPKYLGPTPTLILNRTQQRPNPDAVDITFQPYVSEKTLFHTVHIQDRLRLSGWR